MHLKFEIRFTRFLSIKFILMRFSHISKMFLDTCLIVFGGIWIPWDIWARAHMGRANTWAGPIYGPGPGPGPDPSLWVGNLKKCALEKLARNP